MDTNISKSFTNFAMKAEMLDAETELELARDWRNNNNKDSLHSGKQRTKFFLLKTLASFHLKT